MNNNQDFTTGSIPKKLIAFMLPVLGALILQTTYGAVDLLIVGRFGTTAGIAAVSVGSQIIAFFTFVVAAFSMAVTVLIGQRLGKKDSAGLEGLIGSAICFFTALSVVSAVVLVFFAMPLARLMKTPEDALELTVQYIQICGVGYLFVVAYNFISAIFRGIGNSKLPLVFVAIAGCTNVVGDLLLVAVFKMNVAGAAIATVGAQLLSVVLSLIIIRRQELPFSFSLSGLRFGGEIKEIMNVGLPLVFQEILTNLTFLALSAFINNLGLAASSGYGVAFKIQTFVLLISSSILQSMSAFVAQNVGAGNEPRTRQAVRTGILLGCFAGLVIGSCTFFLGGALSRLFTDDPEVIQRSAECLRGLAADAAITSILFSFLGYFNGHGKSKFVFLQGLGQSLLVRLPVAYFMSIIPGVSLGLVTLSVPAASAFGVLASLIYYKKLKNKTADA